ncbi:hypothetical protein VNI00_009598 [Paramarasmius palmivorus]|uniref:G-alpha-domain-containing protein n=1 Tax=Paramarasmius palmivorus TaxID=297713 RepID=A0AAW0CNY5_9AGAR
MFTTEDASDPFYLLLKPPPNETPAEAEARLKREADARRVNDAIDEEIKHCRAQARKETNVVKVLLLGQAESDFRMRYDQTSWEKERDGWRAVVQLNLVRSIITILGLIEAELSGEVPESHDQDTQQDDDDDDRTAVEPTGDSDTILKFTDKHQLLMIRLAPLRSVEADLQRVLGAGAESIRQSLGQPLPMAATPFDTPVRDPAAKRSPGEFSVRSWHDVVNPEGRQNGTGSGLDPQIDNATISIADCKDDMKALWEDKLIQTAITKRKLRLPDSAGFFLNELDRIASRNFSVTDDDIVRARLRTVGIQEYKVRFRNSPIDAPRVDGAWEWRIYDVGGCRTSRSAWLPFFENTNAIIFLCPVSCFDERLEEDHRVNRLEDSTLLWRSICSSKLLTRTQLILFMNKCDLLKKKLKQGVLVKDYLTSYNDRPNEVMTFVKYLREKFKEILKANSPEPRASYIYPTTVTDTQATAKTLESVRDGVLRENLIKSQLM